MYILFYFLDNHQIENTHYYEDYDQLHKQFHMKLG